MQAGTQTVVVIPILADAAEELGEQIGELEKDNAAMMMAVLMV